MLCVQVCTNVLIIYHAQTWLFSTNINPYKSHCSLQCSLMIMIHPTSLLLLPPKWTDLWVCPRMQAGLGHWPHTEFRPWPWTGNPGWVVNLQSCSWCHWFHWSAGTSLGHGAPIQFNCSSLIVIYMKIRKISIISN